MEKEQVVKMSKFNLKDCFVCDYCRNICKATCNDDLNRLEQGIIDVKNKDLIGGRKQRIKCLGQYCTNPCKYQNLDATIDPQILINTINYLGNELNEILIKK